MSAVRILLFLLTLSFSPHRSFSSDTDTLLKLKKSFTNAEKLASWAPNVGPCGKWTGVICMNNVITGLHLSDLGLSGNIDIEALLQLPGLRTLSFVNNNFNGSIPEFNKLGYIKALYLTKNQFSGPIPSDFFAKLGSLKKVWLSNNKFSGNIPDSLAKVNPLMELHLENNEFSGPIPNLMQEIKSFDVSNNKLEGEIPESLSKFEAKSFAGNEMLCGKPLEKECDSSVPTYSLPTGSDSGNESSSSWATKVIVILFLAAVVAVVFLFVKSRQGKRIENLSMISRDESMAPEEAVQVRMPSINQRKTASEPSMSKKGASESRRAAARSGGMGDIVMVNEEKGVFGLQDLMKAAAEVLGNGGLGSAYKAAMANGLSVVVKRMREMNKIGKDVFDAEMRQFGRIRNKNILTPLAYHYRREEKLFVTEYMPKGSLLYVLHGDRGTCHTDLNWATRLKIVKGIARGLGFLYTEFSTYELPHGNLKSSNVLLTNDYEPLLSDYAFQPLINPNVAVNAMFAYKSPDYIQYQKVSQKTDVYCLGIIILEIITGKFPSQYHSNGKGGTDVVHWVFSAISEGREKEVIDPELQKNTKSLNHMLQLVQIGAACTESNPEQRLNMKEAIRRIEEVQV